VFEELTALAEKLVKWRAAYEQQMAQMYSRQGRVFDFVKGLRFSAGLIYYLRERLSGTQFEVDWGQVVEDNGGHFSPECDVIIHERGYCGRWNGGKTDQVMDFRFIKRARVIAVISCKSFLRSIVQEHRDYCGRMKPYVGKRRLWMFAECVPVGRESRLLEDAKQAGYEKCWYLYSWDRRNLRDRRDECLWEDFVRTIEGLGASRNRAAGS
jgi:hypothetical protein